MLVDSHCHLSSQELYDDLKNVMERAKMAGVSYILNAGGKFDELDKQLEISARFKNVWTVSGVHPHDSLEAQCVTSDDVLKKTLHPKVVAIGECGLDYFYDFSPRDVQIKVFKQMIKAAQESCLPLIVHTREAESDTMEIISDAYQKKAFSGVIHCYSSSYELAQTMLEIGFYISASGMITFKNAESLREAFKKIPLEKILVETDSPYLAPVPMRGKVNEPSYVKHTAEVLAQIKGLEFQKLSAITTENFFKLFSKADRYA